jgi:uncharacterized membrane protein YqjE
MAPLPELAELGAAGRRLAGLAVDLLTDRLELAGLELREAELRLVQGLIVALWGLVLLVAGLALAILAALLFLPPPWRPTAAALAAGLCLVLGGAALIGARRRLARRPLAFSRTIEELNKDRACF